MKWFSFACHVVLTVIVLGYGFEPRWWGWIALVLLVAWWHRIIIASWLYWTEVEEREREGRRTAEPGEDT